MIDGSIVEKENFDAVDLVYHSNNGKDIRIEDIASGFKPLVYMLRLIENGWLTENTLLRLMSLKQIFIHNGWLSWRIFLFASTKTFGTKIPSRVTIPIWYRLSGISLKKEGLLNTTLFFIWQSKVKVQISFYYKNLGCDIEPVFESFNKSFDTLQKYVENYGEI